MNRHRIFSKFEFSGGTLRVADSRRTALGTCPYCNAPVLASRGQATIWLTLVHPFLKEKKQFPTHRKCRKENKHKRFRTAEI